MEQLYKLFIYVEKYRKEIISFFFAISSLMGIVIYAGIYKLGFFDTLSYTLGLFAMDVKTPGEISDLTTGIDFSNGYWKLIFVASTLAKATVVGGVFLLFFRSTLATLYRQKMIANGKHTIVIGLGRNSRFFINSMLEKKSNEHKIIVFEIDKKNEYLNIYKNKKIAIIEDEIEKMIAELNIENCHNIFISTGSDEKNIYYALKIIKRLEGYEANKKLLVHIEDRTFRDFYSDSGVLNNVKLDIKVFSFNKESARMFFQENRLEGRKPLKGDESFSINIVGGDDLSIALVVEVCKLAHYPNGNRLIINCLARDEVALEEKINYAFAEMKEIMNISIKYIRADSDKLSFYDHEVWEDVSNLRHVFYCYDDVKRNISIASKVKERTFLRRRKEMENIYFHIATMNHIKISQELEKNTQKKNFSVFAEADRVCSYENLVENKIDKIAKIIHYNYEKRNLKEVREGEKLNKEIAWSRAKVYEKKSSMGQAIHIRTKLHTLGIDVVENSESLDVKKLYKKNEEVIDKALAMKNDFVGFLDRLTESEHRRWMALLRLMDYQQGRGERKDHIKKYHPLLKEFSEFTDKEKEEYEKYDRDAILKLAQYEAEVGNLLKLKEDG